MIAAVAVAATAVVISLAPLLLHGFGMGHDWIFELVRIAEFRHALEGGQRPPFWAPNLYGGFGSPIFLFYPPLYLAVAAALSACGLGITAAATAALCAFTVIGAVLMWRLLRDVRPDCPAAAAIAVILFSLHPYLLADKWIRNANAEFAAYALLPGVLIGAIAVEPRRRFWWTSICLALVILSHNIVALVAITLVFAVALFVHRRLRAMIPVAGGVLAALAATAFFWVPAMMLQPLIRTEDLLTGKFDFHGQFPTVAALVWPTEFYSGGWLTPILAVVLLFAAISNTGARRIARAIGAATLACLFFMVPLSTWLWETLPLLRFAQFPWRFMGAVAVLLAAGAAVALPVGLRARWRVALAIAVLLIALLNALPAIRQYEAIAPEFTGRIEPALTSEGVQSKDLRTTVGDEYLPRGADLAQVKPVDGARLFKRWAFPVWAARRGGETLQTESGPGGVVAVRIDSEADDVVLSLHEPPVRRITKWLSGAAFALVALMAAVDRFWRAKSVG